ncbi:hypothetical protein R9X47_24130 [Wukongibacter baidiensis]|uniref:hypothetical protein n=1 Tax=Wukongibacter baidiensis TaxID=1723361 RepID=UPI003D7F6D10
MPKSNQELATEITVAWINAVGNGIASGKLRGELLQLDDIQKAYQIAYDSIINCKYYNLKNINPKNNNSLKKNNPQNDSSKTSSSRKVY